MMVMKLTAIAIAAIHSIRRFTVVVVVVAVAVDDDGIVKILLDFSQLIC